MKKSFLSIIFAVMTASVGHAQVWDGMIMQPTHVVGKRISSNGEITREFVSDFYYNDDGKLSRYEFPEYAITASFMYTDDFITQENIFHQGGHPLFHETNIYTYENGQIKTISHLMDQMGFSLYWVYSYYPDGRLERKDYREDDEDESHMHWLYDYENEGKTMIESYYTSWVSQGMLLRKKTTSQYDNNFILSSTYTENYSESGELISAIQTDYSYSSSGLLETKTTQTLIEDEWHNISITRYSYDDFGQITEQLDGTWDTENGEWDFTRKITFETSEDGQTYTVSFYKRNNGDWIWDVFNYQTILWGSHLQAQQRMLSYMVYEDMNGYGNINQFVFTLESMNEPVYLKTTEYSELKFCVYPNPGSDKLKVNAPVENAVIRFYDLQGKLISAHPFDFNTEVSAWDWPSGMYIWEIWHDNQKEACGKWVKE